MVEIMFKVPIVCLPEYGSYICCGHLKFSPFLKIVLPEKKKKKTHTNIKRAMLIVTTTPTTGDA